MKVYRGPSSTEFRSDSHVLVSEIKPEMLEEGVRSKSLMRFNISKEVNARQAVCTVHFEEEDIIPMIRGLLSRLTTQQELLAEITTCLASDKSSELQMHAIRQAMRKRS
jgi:hypothetical protein